MYNCKVRFVADKRFGFFVGEHTRPFVCDTIERVQCGVLDSHV